MWGYIIIGIFALAAVYVLVSYNSLVKGRNRVNEAFSTMDVYLKKRWDLIPNIVETVKGYAKHENQVLMEITALRNHTYDKSSPAEKAELDTRVSRTIGSIMAVAEAYPDLKASSSYIELGRQLAAVEADIANARKYYNGTVRIMNDKIETFPGNLVAGLFGFRSMPMFEADVAERENIKINS